MKAMRSIGLAAAILLLTSCAGFKDTAMGRFYHNLTARFNGYFNAKEKMLDVERNIFDQYADNYNRIIDVLPTTTEKTSKTFGGDLDIIIKKCSMVIKKHDISNWVDDSYFLIGKANFYKRDFFTAIETFQYVNDKYPDTRPGQESLLWLTRCYLEMNKPDQAQAQLSAINGDKTFPDKLKPMLRLIEADYNIRTADYPHAIENIEKALPDVKGKKFKARYLFILAQLNEALHNNEKAAQYFKAVIKKNPVYDLSFQAKLGLADVSTNNKEIEKYLEKLTKDDKNISYYDQIYYVLAKTELKQGNTDKAIEYLNSSVRSAKQNSNQKALSFLMLAEIYFNKPAYPLAKAYYDSAGNFITNEYPGYEKFKARQVVLSDLIGNLINIQRNDSLLKLSMMSKEQLDTFINSAIRNEKERKLKEDNLKNQNNNQPNFNQPLFGQLPTNSITDQPVTQSGYFFNPTALSLGYTDFVAKWGNRPLQDDWRRRNKPVSNTLNTKSPLDTFITNKVNKDSSITQPNTNFGNTVIPNVPADKQKYYAPIPFTPSQKNIANSQIQDGLFAVGNIYYQKLNDTAKGKAAYEELLRRYPDSKYLVQANYNLYRIYSDQKNTEKADYYKNFILKNYPGTDYAMLIENPEQMRSRFGSRNTNPELESFYGQAYQNFLNNNCNEVVTAFYEANRRFEKNYLKPKFEYLKLLCYGKSDTSKRFIDSLHAFTLRYPGDEVSKEAVVLIDVLEKNRLRPKTPSSNPEIPVPGDSANKNISTKAPNPYSKTGLATQYMMVFPSTANSTKVKTTFSDYDKAYYGNLNLDISSFLIGSDAQAIVVTGFPDEQQALKYLNDLQNLSNIYQGLGLTWKKEFLISNENMAILLRTKNVDDYVQFFKDNYL